MAAVLVHGPAKSLDTVQHIADALTGTLGATASRLCFGLGVAGAAIVADIVVTLTAARTLGELLGYPHSLDETLLEARWFYAVYASTLVAGALVVLSGASLVQLSDSVQVMNAMLLPIVLGFLYLLARRLPAPYRLQGTAAVVAAILMVVTIVLGFTRASPASSHETLDLHNGIASAVIDRTRPA